LLDELRHCRDATRLTKRRLPGEDRLRQQLVARVIEIRTTDSRIFRVDLRENRPADVLKFCAALVHVCRLFIGAQVGEFVRIGERRRFYIETVVTIVRRNRRRYGPNS